MIKEQAEAYTKYLSDYVVGELNDFLQKTPIEQLEIIQARLFGRNQVLNSLISDLVNFSKEIESKPLFGLRKNIAEAQALFELRKYISTKLPDIFCFCIIQFLLDSPKSLLLPEQKRALLEKYKITSKTLQDFLLKRHNGIFFEKIKHGGSKPTLHDQEKLLFLSCYNRYKIVIKNARADIKTLKKSKKTESETEKEVMLKYDIPENLIKSVFSVYDSPGELALDWAIKSNGINLDHNTLRRLLTDTRNKIKKKVSAIIIDVEFSNETRIYGVQQNDKEKAKKLKYTPVDKTDNHNSVFFDPESFLVGRGFYELSK